MIDIRLKRLFQFVSYEKILKTSNSKVLEKNIQKRKSICSCSVEIDEFKLKVFLGFEPDLN